MRLSNFSDLNARILYERMLRLVPNHFDLLPTGLRLYLESQIALVSIDLERQA